MIDNRGQSVGIPRFLLALLGALVLAWIVQRITAPILAGSRDAATSAEATQSVAWLTVGVENLFLWFLVIAVFGIVSLSVFQRELLG